MVYDLTITNKKYQPIKVFLSDDETIILNSKETKKIKVGSISTHMTDMENESVISIKKTISGGAN
jgi:hypothetical protein